MFKNLLLLFFILTLFKSSSCFYSNFSAEINNTLRQILAKWEEREIELNTGCAQQLYQVLENMISFDDGFWAYKMIDATGKIPNGLLEGNVAVMGSYEECLNLKSSTKNIKGNYCSITIDISGFSAFNDAFSAIQTQRDFLTYYKKLTQSNIEGLGGQPVASLPVFGLCLPNQCSADDIKNALYLVTEIIPLSIKCQTEDEITPPLDAGAIATITFFGLVVILMLSSTIYDYMSQGTQSEPRKIFIAFSIYTNAQKLFKMHGGHGDLSCLHGIRFFSMCWVIVGHVFMMNITGPTVNLFQMLEHLTNNRDSLLFLNCAHAVDSFFLLSGLLVSYNFMKKMKKKEKFDIFKYYLHRYLRLTPAYAAAILATMYLFKYMGTGPLYYKIDAVLSKSCKDHWWKALLYLQNYLAIEADLCVPQSWNLSIDWQLYLLSPMFLFFLYKTPKFGTIMIILPIIGCMVASFVTTHQNNLPYLIGNVEILKFMKYYYIKTHTRAPTWLIGALLGYILGRIKFYNDKTYSKVPWWMAVLIWLVVATIIPVCIFAGKFSIKTEDSDVVVNSFYNTLVRPTWALCISWIIFACTMGYGGIINDFLSLPIFGVLSKFTYCMYLLHLGILEMMICSRKIPAYFSILGLMDQFCPLFIITFGLSIFWILAFEMPILVLEPYLFRTLPKKKSQVCK